MKLENNSNRDKLYRFFIVLFSILLIFLIFRNQENQENILNIFKSRDISNMKVRKDRTISVEGVKDLGYYSDGIVVHKDNKLIKYDQKGTKVWERDIVLKDYGVHFGRINMFIYDKSIGYIQFLNPQGDIVKEQNLDEEIRNLSTDFQNILVYSLGQDKNEFVYIFDQTGKLLVKNDMGLKNILTYSNAKNDETYGIGSLSFEGDKIKSNFRSFLISGKELYNRKFKGEIILFSKFIDNHRVVIMTDKKVYLLNDFEGNTLWERPYDLIKDIDILDNKINILFGNSLETISANGEIDTKQSFTEEYKNITTLSDSVLVHGHRDFLMLKDGQEINKKSFDDNIVKVIRGRYKFAIIFEDRIDLYKVME